MQTPKSISKSTAREGSVRVDLLGGTLDIKPINYILSNAVTLNLATSLKAKVLIEQTNEDTLEIVSKDYGTHQSFPSSEVTMERLDAGHFGPLRFVVELALMFKATNHLRITLQSGSPAGAGLGGSSAMGVTLYRALAEHTGSAFDRLDAINTVGNVEAKILECGPTGYQDYYPAVFGGVLALFPEYEGVKIEQLFTPEIKQYLESCLTLVYSGQTRLSGINNWEVYKSFFDDKTGPTRAGLKKIADLSHQAYECLKSNRLEQFVELIRQEGEQRVQLFSGILSSQMEKMYNDLAALFPGLGQKVCGAGGGGCFLLIHTPEQAQGVREEISKRGMTVLDFQIEKPI